MSSLKGKTIILGITGSISAYKTPWLIRDLKRLEAEVYCVMTNSAKEFVTPAVLANLSKNHVISDIFDRDMSSDGAWHVNLAHKADIMLIAPCSATSMGKIAHGISDTALVTLTTALPADVPVVISPAMDYTMWDHPSTAKNIEILNSYGYKVIEPESGELSSGLVGKGRLPEFSVIIDELLKHFPQEDEILLNTLSDAVDKDKFNAELELEQLKKKTSNLVGKNTLITAGPTREKIDDVRYISNHSSGKMGFALAEAARDLGANVYLVSGPVSIPYPENINIIKVESAEEMNQAVQEKADEIDLFIMSAAVADYKSKNQTDGKLKKEELGNNPSIELEKNPDILKNIGLRKRDDQFVVGFALEAANPVENAKKKLETKNCDLIILNEANKDNSGFGGDKNTVKLIFKNGNIQDIPTMEKSILASKILQVIAGNFR